MGKARHAKMNKSNIGRIRNPVGKDRMMSAIP